MDSTGFRGFPMHVSANESVFKIQDNNTMIEERDFGFGDCFLGGRD